MSNVVTTGAVLQCTFGAAPSVFNVLPVNMVTVNNIPAANISDYIPLTNILPFGMCTSIANPMVIAATAAALGVLTPMPCIPVTVAPWIVGEPTVTLQNMPILNDSSTLVCSWAGTISIKFAGQVQVTV